MRSRNSRKKSRKKAYGIPRGGFIVPSRGFGGSFKDYASQYVKGQFRKAAGRLGKTTLEEAYQIITDTGLPTSWQVDPTRVIGTIMGAASEATGGGKSKQTFIDSESVTIGSSTANNGNMSQRRYNTKFEVGRPSTRPVRNLARLNGTVKESIVDTISHPLFQLQQPGRRSLGIQAGFNQKALYVPGRQGHIRAGDIWEKYQLSNFFSPQDKLQTSYGMSLKLGRVCKIINTGRYFKAKVTIKLYRSSLVDFDQLNWFSAAITPQAEITAGTPVEGRIPLRYTFAYPESTAAESRLALVDKRASLTHSDTWNENFDFVKSFSKTLAPGELWNYHEIMHLGPGINLNVLKQNVGAPDNPMQYVMVIEAHGLPCVAERASGEEENFIGTSPCYIQTEWKTYHEYVNSSTIPGSVTSDGYNQSANDGGTNTARPAIRSFTKRDTLDIAEKTFNVSVDDLRDTDTNADGQIFIPVMSDKTVQAAGPRSSDGN